MTTILLVEDNEMNRDMLTRRLTRRGFQVAHAENGQDAIDHVASKPVDLVLMDVSLPGMDGLEATRLIRASETTRHLPIIAVTANATTHDRSKAMEAGCDDYQTKPVNFDELMAKMRRFLPGISMNG